MEAETYAGNGAVYEKQVNIQDVAWIDPTQGQYAKVDANAPTTKYDMSFSGDKLLTKNEEAYYQEILENLPESEYNKLTTKKPIRVSKEIFAAVTSARTQLYGDLNEENILTLDIINLGEYGVLNSDDFYFIRNADRTDFSIVKHTKTIKARKELHNGFRTQPKRGISDNSTYTKDGRIGNSRKGDSGDNDYRPFADGRPLGKNVGLPENNEKTDNGSGVSKSSSNKRRGNVSYSSDDLTATHRDLLDRYEQGEITKDEYLAEICSEVFTEQNIIKILDNKNIRC